MRELRAIPDCAGTSGVAAMETGGDKTREVFDRYIIVGDGAAPVVTALERRELAA